MPKYMPNAAPAFSSPDVEKAFTRFPEDARISLLELRALIFEVAARTEGVGKIEETLKWGQPAYLTHVTKSGSTIRLGVPKHGGFGIYTHCQSTIMSDFRAIFPDDFTYEGNRAIHFSPGAKLPISKLETLIKHALTYHLK